VLAAEVPVFNLTVTGPHTFIADGFVVHNKGGGGGGSHGGGHGGGSGGFVLYDPVHGWSRDWGTWIGAIIFMASAGGVVLIIVMAVKNARSGRDENLDYLFSRGNIERKTEKTDELLEFIAKTDTAFNKGALVETAKSTFLELQRCWQARDYDPMKPLMMPELYAEHCAQIEGMMRDHEINVIADLQVERVDIVNVRYTQKPDEREFTALITAVARDYYVDDREQNFLRGDQMPMRFQEFWTFQLQQQKWLLRDIEQTGESGVLREENFFEPFTGDGLKDIYGEKAEQAGPPGPWLEGETGEKATKIERMLNFLVQTDGIWDRRAMIERARQTFLRVYLARQAGDPAGVPSDLLFPEVARSLEEEMRRREAEGTTIEFRNLCVRKVEIILVRNFADDGKDEFTTRITAHAQLIVRKGGTDVCRQEYVTAFEEYWTFARLVDQWMLREVEPPAEGEQRIRAENLDQDSTLSQLEWYYTQPRAV
jgi:predicted lipid-binding transport protein (Tim44 family)